MKKFKMMPVLAALLMLIPAFVSCDKDDNDDPVEVDPVVGSYSGTMTATVSAMGNVWEGIAMEDEYVVKIVRQDKASGKVTVELPECSYTPPMSDKVETIPALVIENVEVEDEGNGIYSLDKDAYELAVGNVQYSVEIHDYDADDKQPEDGTVISGNNIKLVYSVIPGKMPGFIQFTFSGSRK